MPIKLLLLLLTYLAIAVIVRFSLHFLAKTSYGDWLGGYYCEGERTSPEKQMGIIAVMWPMTTPVIAIYGLVFLMLKLARATN